VRKYKNETYQFLYFFYKKDFFFFKGRYFRPMVFFRTVVRRRVLVGFFADMVFLAVFFLRSGAVSGKSWYEGPIRARSRQFMRGFKPDFLRVLASAKQKRHCRLELNPRGTSLSSSSSSPSLELPVFLRRDLEAPFLYSDFFRMDLGMLYVCKTKRLMFLFLIRCMTTSAVKDSSTIFLLPDSDETIGNLVVAKLQEFKDIGTLVGARMPRRDEPVLHLRVDLKACCQQSPESVLKTSFRTLIDQLSDLETAWKQALERYHQPVVPSTSKKQRILVDE